VSSTLVVGDIYTLQGRRADVVELLRETQERVRREPGCVAYAFAEVVADPGHYVVVQEWVDEAALEAHYRSNAFTGYQARVGELLSRPSEVRIHRTTETLHPADPGPMDPRRAD
jgi:quinol monooxygenase YgiN